MPVVALVQEDGVCVGLAAGVSPAGDGGWIGGDGRPWVPSAGWGPVRVVPGDGARVGWVWTGSEWTAPGLSLDVALAAVEEHVHALLARGALVEGIRFPMLERDQSDWNGLITKWDTLFAYVGGRGFPVVGGGGAMLVIRDRAHAEQVTDTLAIFRLTIQALAAGARAQIHAAATGPEREAIVDAFRRVDV